jgi:hypothetical protein
MLKIITIFSFLLNGSVFAKALTRVDEMGIFGARVSTLNKRSELMRLKVNFGNIKFLNKGDKIQFWFEHSSSSRCLANVVGKTNEYVLVKIPAFLKCARKVPVGAGSYIRIYSKDLAGNIEVAGKLVGILLKKRLAVDSKLNRTQRELDSYIEKVEAVNQRYKVLREKLELEWQRDLTALEEDKTTLLRNYNDLKIRLGNVDHKLEQYRIEDKNLRTDRWSLDPKLFNKK